MIEITHRPIEPNTFFDRLNKDASGSIAVHYAVVKQMGGEERRTESLTFQVKGDLEDEMRRLEEELRGKWPVEDVLLVRRVGTLPVGEIISAVAVSAEDRTAAFGLCQEAVDRFKKMRCIYKEEIFEDKK